MKGSFLPATLLTCSIFSCLTLPLAIFGAQSIEIELQKENIFAGRLKDVAMPYLGIVAGVSLGAGLASLSLSEWRKACRKEAQVQEQLSQLQQKLRERETQLETLQLSEPLLRAQGFGAFLEPDLEQSLPPIEPIVPPVAAAIAAEPAIEMVKAPRQWTRASSAAVDTVAQPVGAATVTPLATSAAATAMAQPIAQPPATATPLPAAALPKEASVSAIGTEPLSGWQQARHSATGTVLAQIDHLQSQLKQMTAHVETLQSSLLLTAEAPVAESIEASPLVIEHLHWRLQRLETDLLRSRVAS